MKKDALAFLIFTMAIFLISPLPGEARGGPGSGPGGGYRGGPGGAPPGGGYGGYHGRPGGGYYGVRHGGVHGGYYGRHGGYPGWYGGYRGRPYGGYYGWYGGYRGWYYGGWWYPWAATIPFLPYYYSTIWISGYPYYYVDGTYYAPSAGGYMIVNPPQDAVSKVPSAAPPVEKLFIYPRQGQSEQQQEEDRYQCHRWAFGQTGYDPTQPAVGVPSDQKRADYQRAMSACLDARGYTAR